MTADAALEPDERAAWLAYNDTAEDFPGPHLLARLDAVAREHPDRPAVHAVDGVWTYRELHRRADAVAAFLAARGVRPGSVVAIAATRALAPYAALLGVLKAGCAYVPVNPDDPADRVAFVLADAGATPLLLDTDPASLPAAPAPDVPHEPDRVCYVIYTSGSTGRPKGVVMAERAVDNLTHWVVRRHDVRPDDRLGQTAPLTFDPSVQQVFPAWATGACLVTVPDDVQRDPAAFLDWLRAERVTHLDLVTSHWVHLLNAAEARPAELPDLRWIIIGGETYYYHQTHRWHRVVSSPARLNTIYGPTEAAVNATEHLTEPDLDHGQVPIGVPLPNYRLYALDDDGRLCPPGITGEIHIAGAGLARGYRSAEATAKAFHELEVHSGRTERLYRTGDLARLVRHADRWALEFQGRVDSQVKISGYRVELEEVDAAVKAVPGVRDAAVVVRGEPAEQLVCCYVGDVPPDRLRSRLTERLPAYLVPHLLVPVEALPFTRNGKMDTAELAELVRRFARDSAGRAPRPGVESVVAAVWAEVLDLPEVSADADFLGHGGSSLLAFRVVDRLRRRGIRVRPADVLRERTVAGLAAVAEEDLVLTPSTRLALRRPGGNATLDIGLPADVPAERVRAVLEDIVRRHPVLRARIDDDGPRAVPVDRFELHTPDGPVDDAKARLAESTDLTTGLPTAAALVAGRLLVSIRHELVDGAALRRVAEEVAAGLGRAPRPRPVVPVADQPLGGPAPDGLRGHLVRFLEAEKAALAALPREHRDRVVEVDLGHAPDALLDTPPTRWHARLVAAAATAARSWLGLVDVPVGVPRHWPGAGGSVANLADVLPLVVADDDEADAQWRRFADPAVHWGAALLDACPDLADDWPAPRIAPQGSFRLVVTADDEPLAPDLPLHESPTAFDPASAGAVEFAVVAGDRLRLHVTGWDLPADEVKAVAAGWVEALAGERR
ncbi:amino acid adenylation domain-containing protein [Saccharothrix sp. NPDC042600]|uniref:CmnG n=1 Tax=Saccharothrix mutabilis subsp. capreolus TaxID=66854 RepID=A6YEH8_STRMP|nr:CmnG [Saccharothrix mutabilis subsp. capreolus]BFE50451.1 hypothetical protein GCM10017745_38780 [Saccharothrix mutabilis subsp. capreolus]